MTALVVFGALLGICIGSFLNVVAYRYNTGMSVNGRSQCFSCGKTLRWDEVIPVLSFLIQRGKCRGCKSRISWQYPAVELLTGFMFALFLYIYPPLTFYSAILLFYYLVIVSLLIVIFIYDMKHKIIPDGLVFAFAGLTFIKLFISITPSGIDFVQPSLWNLLAGFILALPFFLLWLVSEGKWMGLGDAKLALGIGWFLGLLYGVSAIILAFWIGAAFGLALIALRHLGGTRLFHRLSLSLGAPRIIMKSEIPFAPFLILGILIVFFTHFDILGLSLIL